MKSLVFIALSALCQVAFCHKSDVEIDIFTTNIDNIEIIVDKFMVQRNVDSEGNKQVRQYIIDTLFEAGWSVEVDSFSEETSDGFHSFANVIGRFYPERTKQMILACHYDTLREPAGFVGATDSAVPCSIMLDLAQSLTPYLRALNDSSIGITMVFFDGEEALVNFSVKDSLYGSKHLAERWYNEVYMPDASVAGKLLPKMTQFERIDVFILLDLIGTAKAKFPMFVFDGTTSNSFYEEMMAIEATLADLMPSDVEPCLTGEYKFGMIGDDHVPFFEKGLTRILHLISYPFPSVWHTLADNKLALDFDYIERFSLILKVYVANYISSR